MVSLLYKIYKKLEARLERQMLLEKLYKEQKFFEIYEIFGSVDEKKFKKMYKNDIEIEIGKNHKFNKYLFLENLKLKIKTSLIMILIAILLQNGADNYFTYCVNNTSIEEIYDEEALKDLEQIKEQYQKDIQEYAEDINDLNLTNLEIFVKVMYDMWENIYGYKTPANLYDNFGVMRYNLYNYNYGVCRQFADDYANRLNEINPEYHAQVINVYYDNTFVNNIQYYSFVPEENNTEESKNNGLFKMFLRNEIGNHTVVMVTIPDKDYSLILDPTNPSIGVLENGKIYMLNSDDVSKNNMKLKYVNY